MIHDFATSWIGCGAPESGRRTTLVEALRLLHDHQPTGAHIVEIGTSRNTTPAACKSDGWATRVFAWYAAHTAGLVTTIDNRTEALERAYAICGEWADAVLFRCGEAVDVVRALDTPPDLLYLDGPPEPHLHLDVYRALPDHPPLVLIDDVLDEQFRPKGELVADQMLRDGYRLVFSRDRQALFAL